MGPNPTEPVSIMSLYYHLDVVGYEGKKSDRCKFVNNIFENVITNIVKNNTNPIPTLTKAMSDLDSGKES